MNFPPKISIDMILLVVIFHIYDKSQAILQDFKNKNELDRFI